MPSRHLSFSGPAARVQYALLMGLFRLAVTRPLYGRFARGLGRIFGPDTAVWLHEGAAAPYRIALDDGSWTRFALYHAPYEAEVARVLQAAAGATPLFCDLGANKGYWTTRAARYFAQVIAVKASGNTYRDLVRNVGPLANVILHRAAIHAASGEVMRFVNTYQSHASARLDHGAPARPETLAGDDLAPPGTAVLIKLDVEGAEIAAIDGAARARAEGAVLIYEDHGNDPDCMVSAPLLRDPDMRLFAIEDGLVPMRDLATLRGLKTEPCKGYNFLAARRDSALLGRIVRGFATAAKPG